MRKLDETKRRLVSPSTLHSRATVPKASARERREETQKEFRKIDSKAVADARREANREAQVPRPARGGGFERNRSRH